MSNRQPPSHCARLAGFPWLEAMVGATLFATMTFHQRSLEPSVVALQFTYDREAFSSIIVGWGEGAALLPNNLFIDLAFMLAYGFFGFRLATRTPLAAFLPTELRPAFPWILPAAATADAVENLLELHLAGHLGTATHALFLSAGAVSGVKWALITFFAATVLAALRRPA